MNKKVLLLIIATPFVAILALALPWLIIGIGFQMQPNPPLPEIKNGEFPFKLVYELNGEQIIVEDTLICEYIGVKAGSNGKHLVWKEYLKSNPNEDNVLLRVEDDKKIYFAVEGADYYLGGAKEPLPAYDYEFSNVFYAESHNRVTSYGHVRSDELLNTYGIKLISWEHSQPIKNTFS